jgi:hypothetical protein
MKFKINNRKISQKTSFDCLPLVSYLSILYMDSPYILKLLMTPPNMEIEQKPEREYYFSHCKYYNNLGAQNDLIELSKTQHE